MAEFGPIQMLAIGFPDVKKLDGELLREIFRLSDAKIIRIVGLLAIAKDENGAMVSAQITQLSPEDRLKLGAGIRALIGMGAGGVDGAVAGVKAGADKVAKKISKDDFGISEKDVQKIAKNIPDGTAAGLLLIEHLWAKRFKEIARAHDGVLLGEGFLTPEALVAMGARLAESARTAERVKMK